MAIASQINSREWGRVAPTTSTPIEIQSPTLSKVAIAASNLRQVLIQIDRQ
ncbi:hypothetical protein [Coleofasciculus sp. H7-2]|uniref:hypothetical protein n=1 Tax=Coleofasciculus sp. H7-2 TaxID=3351545 RepID=UPI00366B00DB